MSLLGGLFDAATKAVGSLVGGGNPISGLVDTATHALGGLLGDATGDKIGDKVGDLIGDVIHSDKIGDKIGDLLGDALGGEGKIVDGLAGGLGGIGDKIGDLLGGGEPANAIANILGGASTENAATMQQTAAMGFQPESLATGGDTDMIDLSQLLTDASTTGVATTSASPALLETGALASEFSSEFAGEFAEMTGEMSAMPVDTGEAMDTTSMTSGEMSTMQPEMMQMMA